MKKKNSTDKKYLYKLAFGLAFFTIIYNIIEGLVAAYFGYEDESLALFGFGIDSFIEVISGLGIAHMVLRIQSNPNSNRDSFEKTALRITGFSFYALVIGMVISAIYNILTGNKPETTFWGVIIALASIIIMWILIIEKKKVGKLLDSDAILADAECTKVCIYMSIVLLISSGIYELTNFAYIDSFGTLGLAYFAFKEGKECFEKAKHNKYCSCEND
ncbi:cation transporter [Flavobacterium soyangense]|uniref:Cation transporter n=1 Tax=Flavobacterium soyangense TaxID=2023265 RepID=A0A930U640_9FLAO|nr:cation transporter [Flavobacterium soyangense]MBF2707588.1 cation transporter [Flavobacterium soyangense]